MARAWYTSESVRRAILRAGAFFSVPLVCFLLLRIPAVSKLFERVEAGVVRVGTGIGNAYARLTLSETSLAVQFQACQDNLRTTSVTAASSDELSHEVTELQALLGYVARTGAVGITTQVIARAVDDDATRVIVDKGSEDGVVQGSAAVIGDGVLFGLVDEVREQNATIQLVAHPQSNLPAAILGKTRTIGLVQGREGALLSMEFIPQDAELKVGDLVVTSGLDGLVQQGLVIGLVTEIVTVESAPFQKAFIELLYEPREWTTVMILPPPGL